MIHEVENLTEEMMESAGGAGSSQGTGGMRTKLKAAKLVCENGIDMVITNGDTPENLYDIVDGDPIGTRFLKKK